MLLDFGIGILASIWVSKLFAVELNGWLISGGMFLAVAPDLDFIFGFLGKKGKAILYEDAYQHRVFPHKPLFFIPLVFGIIFFFSPLWAALFFFCAMGHFIHDSVGIGRGIQWLYPFSKKSYVFFYFYKNPKNKSVVPGKNKFGIYVWTPAEVREISKKFGDPDWIKNIYFKFHPYFLVEIAGFVLSLVLLFWVK